MTFARFLRFCNNPRRVNRVYNVVAWWGGGTTGTGSSTSTARRHAYASNHLILSSTRNVVLTTNSCDNKPCVVSNCSSHHGLVRNFGSKSDTSPHSSSSSSSSSEKDHNPPNRSRDESKIVQDEEEEQENPTTTTTSSSSTKQELHDKVQEDKEQIGIDAQIDDEYTQKLVIEMPDIGDLHTKGKILKWYKQEGDVVRPNDTICDIETDLFTFGMDVEDENEGIMKEILVKEGDEESLKPGTPICTIMHKPMK